MIALIAQYHEPLINLCRCFHVRRLEVFGSAVSGDFRFGQSDLDFLVEFEPLSPSAHADAFFGFLEGLESLFKSPIDLVEKAPIRNPYLLEKIEQTKELVYAAA
jgi:predicted nucleotidyltransferase